MSETQATTAPQLTPEIVRTVLGALMHYADAGVEDVVQQYMADGGFGLPASDAATAALERAGSVRPVIDTLFAQLPCWSRADFDSITELRALRNDPRLRELKALKHTVYAILGGAYAHLDHLEDAAHFEELVDQCSDLGNASSDEPAVQAAAFACSWAITMAQYPLDGSAEDRRTVMLAACQAAAVVGSYLASHEGLEAYDAFLGSLRAIAATPTH